jgi:hypothetical protein
MIHKTELPQICSCQQLRLSNKPKIYHQQEYTANDHKLPTTISEIKFTGTFSQKCTGTLLIRSVAEENFSLAE